MSKITEVINRILDFSCEIDGDKIIFTGILQKEGNNIVINARTTPPEYRKMRKHQDLNIYSNTNGHGIACLNAHIKKSSETYYDGGKYNGFDYSNLIIMPDQIAVGGCFGEMPQVKKISALIPELNYFFMHSSPLELTHDFSKNNKSVLNFTSLKKISAKDEYGNVEIWRTFGQKETVNEISFNLVPYVSYEFHQEVKLSDAIVRLASIRNLFSFFADGYIGLGEISFLTPENDKECYLWMNHLETTESVNEDFYITFADIENDFQNIWTNWVDFYDKTPSLVDLFYEIICGHSTGTNELLNFAQAIEIYSNTYLKNEIKELVKKEEPNRKFKYPPFLYIYKKLLENYNDVLEINESNMFDELLSSVRNYYTHYDSEKYTVKPSYKEMFSVTRILHYLLLSIVYKALGISCSIICRCKKRLRFSLFENDVNRLGEFANKSLRRRVK